MAQGVGGTDPAQKRLYAPVDLRAQLRHARAHGEQQVVPCAVARERALRRVEVAARLRDRR